MFIEREPQIIRDASVSPTWTGLVLAGLLFLPGALGFLFEGTSFATGTAAICLVALLLAISGVISVSSRDIQMSLSITAVVVFLIVLHLFLADAIDSDPRFDIPRAGLSLLLLGMVAVTAPAVSTVVMAATKFGNIVRIICALFAISAALSLLKIQPPTSSLGEKPIFPFTEPSFLGFSFAGILIFTMMRSSNIIRVITIIVFIGLGYALSNLTIIATCVLAAVVALPFSMLVAGFVVLSIGAASIDLFYYTDRLDFDWANSTNLSSLVYVQGWQMLQESLQRTHGWGVGFQQLGVVYTNVPSSVRINALLGRDANLQDGGFILSKLGSEFGFIGFAFVAFYLFVMANSFLKLRLTSWRRVDITDGELFARACVIGYLIEMFVRGTNYFTGTFVLLIAALIHLKRIKTTVLV